MGGGVACYLAKRTILALHGSELPALCTSGRPPATKHPPTGRFGQGRGLWDDAASAPARAGAATGGCEHDNTSTRSQEALRFP